MNYQQLSCIDSAFMIDHILAWAKMSCTFPRVSSPARAAGSRESSRRSRLGLDFRASGALSPAVAGVIVLSSLQVRYRQREPDKEGQQRLKILLLASFQLVSGVGGRVHVFLSPHKEMAFELQEHEEKESSTSARHYDLCQSRFVDRRHPTRQGRPEQQP